MVVIKDGQKYYTIEEAKKLLDSMIEEDAKNFAAEVIRRQKELYSTEEEVYV